MIPYRFGRRPAVGLVLALTLMGLFMQANVTQAASWPTLQVGSRGTDVKTAQHLLVARHYPLTVDGIFGNGTKSAVVSFQRSKGLGADGIVGPLTWNALVITVQRGASGSPVTALQEQLNANGCSGVAIDGAFGPGTEAAVRAFQSANGLAVDGIVGPHTWESLLSGGSCSASGGGGSTRAALARQILANRNIDTSGRLVKTDLQDTAAGKRATAGTYLSATLLRLIVALGKSHTVRLTALESGGTGHSPNSYHYSGDAVDIGSLDGHLVTGRNAPSLTIINAVKGLMPAGSGFGQSNCGLTPPLPSGVTTFPDTCNHLHIQVTRGAP